MFCANAEYNLVPQQAIIFIKGYSADYFPRIILWSVKCHTARINFQF